MAFSLSQRPTIESDLRRMKSTIQECLRDITLLYASRGACPYVFHREQQRIDDFRKAWKTACKKVGVEGRLFHDLRRTAVRNLVRTGTSEKIAMDITGHRTREVFDRYNIVNRDDMRRAIERLGHHKNITIAPQSGQTGMGEMVASA